MVIHRLRFELTVYHQHLQKLLSSLRATSTFSSFLPTGISALDQLLSIFHLAGRQPQQQQQPQNHLAQTQHPPVIEITGISTSSGKTQLLCHLISLALLPQAHHGLFIGGQSSAVILLDLSGRFPVLRLRDIMAAYIQDCILNSHTASSSLSSSLSSSPPPSHLEVLSLVRKSLLHLHVFTPLSSSSVLDTLASLSSYLLTEPFRHFSARRRISHLVLNDLSAFLWQDRLDEMEASFSPNEPLPSNQKTKTPPVLQYYRNLVSSLRSIQSLFSCQITATSSSLATPISINVNNGNHLALRPHLPAVWTNFRTAQLILERPATPKFRFGISAREAESERAEKQKSKVGGEAAADRGQRVARVNWWGSEEWRDDIKDGVIRWEKNWGGFGGVQFWIADGIRVQGEGKKRGSREGGWSNRKKRPIEQPSEFCFTKSEESKMEISHYVKITSNQK